MKSLIAGAAGLAVIVVSTFLVLRGLAREGETRRYREGFVELVRREGSPLTVIAEDRDPVPARSDRCLACHLATTYPGFEGRPHPYRTHPTPELHTGDASPHPVGTTACASCHPGDPHARDWRVTTQASCRACHRDTPQLAGAERWSAGMLALRASGCQGCHRGTGWDELPKPGPSLTRLAGKLSRAWVARWLRDPHAVTPGARMPRPALRDETEIAAVVEYLFASAEPYSADTPAPMGDSGRGKKLFATVGCAGCHSLDDAAGSGGRFGSAPDLSAVGSKVSRDWLATWLRHPTHYLPHTKMPSLRLTGGELGDLVAYLMTKRFALTADGPPKAGDAEAGRRAIARVGCYGCHEIRGFEKAPPVGPSLAEFRGDASPSAIRRLHVGTVDYAFAPAEEATLAPALRGLAVAPRQPIARDPKVVAAFHILQKYNCQGCHAIEGLFRPRHDSDPAKEEHDRLRLELEARILREYPEDETLGPPPLVTEGARVHGGWLRAFLADPGKRPVRPALTVRMPTFPFREGEVDALVAGWAAYAHVDPAEPRVAGAIASETAKQAEQLLARLQCLSCHTWDRLPPGPVEGSGSLGLAPAFSEIPGRLRAAWTARFLANPGALVPGTRMPGFWSGGSSPAPELLGGDPEAQTRAITEHLVTGREP